MFEARIPLRWSDLDAQQHVNNVVYLDFLQEARVQFLRSTSAASLLDEGVVVTGHQVEYLRPIEYHDQPITVELALTHVGAARFEVAYTIHDKGELAMRARTTCCPFDFVGQHPRRLRPEERGPLEAHLETQEPLASLGTRPLQGVGHEAWITPRWSDQDVYRHVNNVHTVDYFQEARARMLVDLSRRLDEQAPSPIWYAVRQDVAYRGQTDYRTQPYLVRTGVTRLGNSSFTSRSELLSSGDAQAKPHATLECVMVCGDPATGRPMSLSDDVRRALETYAA